MGSIGSMGKPRMGFLGAAIQFPAPVVNSRADIDAQVESIVRTLKATKAGYPGVELIVFPEYSTQGLNTAKWLTDEFLCDIPGPETEAFSRACQEAGVYGVFSIMERNPDPTKNPYNTAIIIDPAGEIVLKYRKLFPWNPIEPWYPGDLGMPVCEGPGGSKLAVCICHDGMIPELAREAGMEFEFHIEEVAGAHPNSVRVVVEGDGRTMEAVGYSIGGGAVLLHKLDGFQVDISCALPAVIIMNKDVQGVVSAVTSYLSAHGVNIATMRLHRDSRGGLATMVIELDPAGAGVDTEVMRNMHPGIVRVIKIEGED